MNRFIILALALAHATAHVMSLQRALAPHSSAATRAARILMAHADDEHIDVTRRWISDVVIRLGLCPYAAKPFVADEIRYVVSEARDDEALLDDFFAESALLLDVNEDDLATTFLIAPHYKEGIEPFYALYEFLADTLESAPSQQLADDDILSLVGDKIQPAFFHPEWSFDGLPDSDPTHFEKRAPLPVVNLLRRASLDRVVQHGLDKGVIVNKEIAEHNEQALRREGFAALEQAFARLRRE